MTTFTLMDGVPVYDQDWLVTCADVIARVRHEPVEWVTPLGWPVLQPYFRTNKLVDRKRGNTVKYE